MKKLPCTFLGVRWRSSVGFACLFLLMGCASLQQQALEDGMVMIERETGLKEVPVPNTTQQYLGKTHRGYQVLFHGKAGNVWGRYAARIAMGEIGREAGGVLAFLTGSYEWGTGPAGSILDRLLARVIGQPLSVALLLKHGKPDAPRLDVLSSVSTVKPEDALPKVARVGLGAGSVRSQNTGFANRVAENAELMARMKKMRGQYIRVDEETVTLLWAGQEEDFSAMIRNYKGYGNMLNAFMDTLADIADAIPEE